MKFWSILLFVMMMPFVASCGGDDEKSEVISDGDLISKAIGTWICTQSIDTQSGQSYQGMMIGKEITIYANGTYTSTAQSFGYTGIYSVSGNTITAKSNSGGTFVFSVTFSGTKMIWEGTANNGVSFKYTFNRESDIDTNQLEFTKDMIAGEFSWVIKDFSFVRGSNSNIQKGKSIHFKTDGTCESYQYMEDAWRINNGRIETYYKKTNEPMFVYTLLSQKGDEITVQMNGTLDNVLQVTITLSKEEIAPQSQTVEEGYWTSKESVIGIYSACYASCSDFAGKQSTLEQMRISSFTNITPSSNEIQQTWENAYQVINRINLLLDNKDKFTNILSNQEQKHLIAELRGLRAFVYYNISMLWGDVPLVKTANFDIDTYFTQSSQNEVFLFAYNETKEIIADLKDSNTDSSNKYLFTKDAGYMLLTELEMTLGNHATALNYLNQIDASKYVTTRTTNYGSPGSSVIWGLKQSEIDAFYPIYTFTHGHLYNEEASDRKEGLEKNWQTSCSSEYGYWAALKRLGKAQAITGCYDYQLLMPFPISEITRNPYMKQNPGY